MTKPSRKSEPKKIQKPLPTYGRAISVIWKLKKLKD